MSSGAIGGQIEQLTTLKQKFDAEAGDIDRLLSSIEGQLANTYWVGGAADRFRNERWAAHKKNLQQLAGDLREASHEVETRKAKLIEVGS